MKQLAAFVLILCLGGVIKQCPRSMPDVSRRFATTVSPAAMRSLTDDAIALGERSMSVTRRAESSASEVAVARFVEWQLAPSTAQHDAQASIAQANRETAVRVVGRVLDQLPRERHLSERQLAEAMLTALKPGRRWTYEIDVTKAKLELEYKTPSGRVAADLLKIGGAGYAGYKLLWPDK